jgi:hypothetical protein
LNSEALRDAPCDGAGRRCFRTPYRVRHYSFRTARPPLRRRARAALAPHAAVLPMTSSTVHEVCVAFGVKRRRRSQKC